MYSAKLPFKTNDVQVFDRRSKKPRDESNGKSMLVQSACIEAF